MIYLQDIKDARKTIRKLVKRTPLIRSQFLSDFCGGKVYLKLENLQITNSFKIRGALNRTLHLSTEEKKRGVPRTPRRTPNLLMSSNGEATVCFPYRLVTKNAEKWGSACFTC